MPRTVSAVMQTHLQSEEQTVALCWRIQRRDGTNYYYTDHDQPIIYSGNTYTPVDAGSPSNFRQASDLSPSNMDIGMVFSSTAGRDAELRAGLFDYAEIWTFRINWSNPSSSMIVKLVYGKLGEVQIRDNEAKIEVRTLTQILASAQIGEIYTPECRTNLGTTLCKVSINSTTYNRAGTVSAVSSSAPYQKFTVSGSAAGQTLNFYSYGKATFNSGQNSGIAMQVKSYSTSNVVTLFEPMPYTLTTGVSVTMQAGCDRRWYTCRDRFDNRVNFRGFPHIPGMDKATFIPANQKWTED